MFSVFLLGIRGYTLLNCRSLKPQVCMHVTYVSKCWLLNEFFK